MSRLEALQMVRGSISNWPRVAFFLMVKKHKWSMNIRFRDGTILENVTDPRIVLTMVRYYFHATQLGIYSKSDMLLLYQVGNEIASRISNIYTDREIESCSTGGVFGYKEALLFALIRKYRPKTVVETGVAQGVTTYVILAALEENRTGTLVSVDLPNRNPSGYTYSDGSRHQAYVKERLKAGWLVPPQLNKRWTLKEGRTKDILPTLVEKAELFLHDSEHSYENMTFEYEWAYERLPVGGILMSDDISWNSAFDDFLSRHKDMMNMFTGTGVGVALKTS